LRVHGRRPTAHELSPTAHDPPGDARGVHGSSVARGVRVRAPERLPVLVLRRRDARRTGAGMSVDLTVDATDGPARAGTAITGTGRTFSTPAFMPVGTRGAVRALDSRDVQACGAEILLANTYHLMLR